MKDGEADKTKKVPNVIDSLINLAKAFQQNPWYLSVILAIYLDGYFINKYLLHTNPPSYWIVPELATGLIWICLIATIILVSTYEFMPLTHTSAKYVLIACIVVATGTLGDFIIMIAVMAGFDRILLEIKNLYDKDFRMIALILTALIGISILIWFFNAAVKAARKSIEIVSKPQIMLESKVQIDEKA